METGCGDRQTRKYNEEVTKLPNVSVLTISNDLPFAQRRWCAANGLENVATLSDHKDLSFGKNYGVAIEELRLLARSVFVVNSNDEIVYAEYVPESTDEVDFAAALEAAASAE